MSFTPFAKMQKKLEESEDELNNTLRELSNTQALLQKEKSSNREMREEVERASGRLSKNLARLELLEKKISYSDLFMQAKDVKCWKKDSDNEVKALNLRILQAVTTLEQMQRSGKLSLTSNSQDVVAPPKEFHCDCCQQKNKPGIIVRDGKVIHVPPQNASAAAVAGGGSAGGDAKGQREADASLRTQNRQLLGQIDSERKRRREAENLVEELKATTKNQKQTMERLEENRRADPSANVDVNAIARARADSTFTQTRIRELEEVIAMKADENMNLQRAMEKERQRADLNEKEVNRVEKDFRELRRKKDDEKNEELRKQIKEHFDKGKGMTTTANVDVMKMYIRDLEAQIENPDNEALIKRIDACITRVDALEEEKKGLKEYILSVHKKLEEGQKEMDVVCKRLEHANEKNDNLEIRRRESGQIADRMSEAKNRVELEFDNFKRSVETGLGNLNDNIAAAVEEEVEEEEEDEDLDISEADLEHIDPSELEDFLKNF